MIRVALDSNILCYLAAVERSEADAFKIIAVKNVIRTLVGKAEIIVSVQALGELYVVLRRSKIPSREAHRIVERIASGLDVVAVNQTHVVKALGMIDRHPMQYWDAVILVSSASAGAALLLSEDMQHGFTILGLTIVNPLVEPMHPKLAALANA